MQQQVNYITQTNSLLIIKYMIAYKYLKYSTLILLPTSICIFILYYWFQVPIHMILWLLGTSLRILRVLSYLQFLEDNWIISMFRECIKIVSYNNWFIENNAPISTKSIWFEITIYLFIFYYYIWLRVLYIHYHALKKWVGTVILMQSIYKALQLNNILCLL